MGMCNRISNYRREGDGKVLTQHNHGIGPLILPCLTRRFRIPFLPPGIFFSPNFLHSLLFSFLSPPSSISGRLFFFPASIVSFALRASRLKRFNSSPVNSASVSSFIFLIFFFLFISMQSSIQLQVHCLYSRSTSIACFISQFNRTFFPSRSWSTYNWC